MGHQMRIELTRAGLLVYLANHYTTQGALLSIRVIIYQDGSVLSYFLCSPEKKKAMKINIARFNYFSVRCSVKKEILSNIFC